MDKKAETKKNHGISFEDFCPKIGYTHLLKWVYTDL